MDNLSFRSNVGRDILQNSDFFSIPEKAIIEYVKNGLGPWDSTRDVEIHVKCDQESFSISDNGDGMSYDDIKNRFLVMHGENYDRKKGKNTDGLFGTGKSAAFGIAEILSIKTVKNKLLNHIEIHKKDIMSTKDTDFVPIKEIEINKEIDADNGSLIEIKNLTKSAKQFNENAISKKIKDTIRLKKGVRVWFQDDLIEVIQPEVEFEKTFNTQDFKFLETHLSKDYLLTIKVARSPLEKEDKGIAIYSNKVYLGTTLAGQDTKTHINYIFGELDVDELDNPKLEVKPFLNTRDGLNVHSPLVKALNIFIGNKIEEVHSILEEKDKLEKEKLDAKKDRKLADAIEKKLNDHLKKLQDQFLSKLDGKNIHNNKMRGERLEEMFKKGSLESLMPSYDNNVRLLTDKKLKSNKKKNDNRNKGIANEDKNAERITKKSRSGGITVQLKNLGEREHRGRWVQETNEVIVNTGHRQIKKLRDNGGTENENYNFIVYEVATNEYAYGLTRLYIDEKKLTSPSEALVSYRELVSEFAGIFDEVI